MIRQKEAKRIAIKSTSFNSGNSPDFYIPASNHADSDSMGGIKTVKKDTRCAGAYNKKLQAAAIIAWQRGRSNHGKGKS